MQQLRDLPPVDKEKPVLVAGDPERAMKAKYESEGIHIHPNLVQQLSQIGESLKVGPFPATSLEDQKRKEKEKKTKKY